MKIQVRKPTEDEKKTAASWPIWTKEASSFPWHYDEPETCLILEGEATIRAGDERISFAGGDLVIFPRGLDCTWNISKAIRKHYRFG
ncbi:MAG TPA: cupin [Elusimicrobia bacterium]|nr:cupin [Elusimicrobiota bacterium]HBT61136.1 cupin [Elusimicrobiota bacterium]